MNKPPMLQSGVRTETKNVLNFNLAYLPIHYPYITILYKKPQT